ncbi:MAG: stage II sporulation protein P [Blautia sp.]|nr:stage II sporulation protein P [Blautia sp.]
MRSKRAGRSRGLLLFFVILQLTAAGACLYHWGGILWTGIGRNLSIQVYNGVLNIYVPGFISTRQEGGSGIYRDMTAAMYPALAANEEMLWYESRAEELMDYENLAAQENASVQRMIAENQSAGTAAESRETKKTAEERRETEAGEARETEAEETQEVQTASADGKKVTVNRKKLEDFDYLLQNFYQVDKTTTIGSGLLNAKKLLAYDLTLDEDAKGPQILIYHTHSQEGYKDSVAGDSSTTVVGLGDRLTELLTAKGYRVLHDKGTYDLPKRDRAYSAAAPYIEQILEDNPGIEVVIDLHRDGVGETVHLVTEQNGKKTAQIMFFNGLSHTTAVGDIAYLKNPYIKDNLAFSLQMQLAAAEYYPDYSRCIYLKGYRYNMHFVPKSLLVEVGAQTNTVEEAMNAMDPLADILDKVLSGEYTKD